MNTPLPTVGKFRSTTTQIRRQGRGGTRPFLAHRAGFSLIEVIVAILILGIALVALTEGVTTALASNKDAERQTTAAMLAAGQIETLRAEGDLTDGETDGDFGDALPMYQWKQTISATTIEGLHDVDVVILNAQTGKTIYELKTMLFEVPQSANADNQPGGRQRPAAGNAGGSR